MSLLHGPPSDPEYGGQLGNCDGGGRGGCGKTVNAVEGYFHCDECQMDSCQSCIGAGQKAESSLFASESSAAMGATLDQDISCISRQLSVHSIEDAVNIPLALYYTGASGAPPWGHTPNLIDKDR